MNKSLPRYERIIRDWHMRQLTSEIDWQRLKLSLLFAEVARRDGKKQRRKRLAKL